MEANRPRLIAGKPDHQNLIRRTGKYLTLIGNIIDRVPYENHPSVQIQPAVIILYLTVLPVKPYRQIPERLIGLEIFWNGCHGHLRKPVCFLWLSMEQKLSYLRKM